MRAIVWVVLVAALVSGCAASGEPTSQPTWNRARFLRATPTVTSGAGAGAPAATATPDPDRTPHGTPTAHPAVYGRRVGALFSHDIHGDHFCTASAVDSPGRNMIITAAHCVHQGKGGDYVGDLVFVPGYRDGNAPYGVWKVKSEIVDDRWARRSDPDLDVGFAVLEPLGGKNIADVLGSNSLGINEGFTNFVRVTGYPMNSDEPVTCVNTTSRKDTYQLRFACEGYSPGTSGSPWLAHYDPVARKGEVIGVIGGYHRGGNGDIISYSAYFDEDVRRLYDEAVRVSVRE